MNMKLKIDGNTIHIYGVIKTIQDAEEIKKAISKFKPNDNVVIKIYDSFAVLSSVIGELLKAIDNGINISMEVKEDVLYELFDNLNLIDILNVKRI